MELKSLLQHIIDQIDTITAVANSGATWKTKFELCFGAAGPMMGALSDLNLSLNWADPDMSYEDDLMSFVHEINEMRGDLVCVLEGLNGDRDGDKGDR